MMSKKEFPKGTLILFLSFIILMAIIFFVPSAPKKMVPQDLLAVLRPLPTPIQPFTLTDKNNQPFSNDHLKGKWSFIFFGYTHCPDVCPTTLNTLKQVNNALKKTANTTPDMQVIFVSVDPQRDNLEMLGKYTAYFSKEFIPVTGSADNLLHFSRQFSAIYMKEETGTPGDYLINHTSSIFLVDPDMKVVASFSPPHYAETITSQYLKIHDMYK